MNDNLLEKKDLIDLIRERKINFFPINHKIPNYRFLSIFKVAYFAIKVSLLICKKSVNNDVAVGIGSFYESFPLFLVKKICAKKIHRISWIRGIWKKESRGKHGQVYSFLSTEIEKYLLGKSELIISNGEDTKKYYEKIIQKNIICIPNAINIKKFEQQNRNPFSGEIVKIAYIGRLSSVKGIKEYIESIKIFNENILYKNSIVFEIVGDGDLLEFVKESAKSIENLFFVGKLSNSEVIQYLNDIDVGVALTFSKEIGGGGVSNGLLEIMASKRLAIAWNSKIFTQVLNDEQACLIEEGDIHSLANVYLDIIKNKEKYKILINNSAKQVQKYSIESHVESFIIELNKISPKIA